MRALATLMLALALGACAFAPPAADADRLFADHLFRAAPQPVQAQDVFAVSDEMRHYLVRELGSLAKTKGRQQALVEALRDSGQLRLEYDAAFTRNAREAFEARTGNCLSLAIMTAAFARELGVPVRYQNVVVDETWSRRGDLYFSAGHVNLALGANPPRLGTRIDDGAQLIIDFLPPPDLRRIKWRVIEEKTIVAMFMNNRAAESIAAGRMDDAYWYAREAILQDPDYMSPYNTLGVVYHRSGHLDHAALAFRHVLEREPSNTLVLSNLAPVLARLGRADESRALEGRLARLQPEPPFAFFHRGLAAMREGDYRAARDLFAREVARDPYYHEFHFWLALALSRLGEDNEARRHLALALETSTTRKDHELYAAKLGHIKSSRLYR
jgi:tetratricopeptide (TPR) repeat protein